MPSEAPDAGSTGPAPPDLREVRAPPFRVLGRVFFVLAAILAGWTVWLTARLPSHHVVRSWDLTWGGFDALLTVMLIATGIALVRRSPWIPACAVATAALLVVDAWFDVTTAHGGAQLRTAVLAAVAVELPVAASCLYVARRSERSLWRGTASASAMPSQSGAGDSRTAWPGRSGSRRRSRPRIPISGSRRNASASR
jgi:hypothetical protein